MKKKKDESKPMDYESELCILSDIKDYVEACLVDESNLLLRGGFHLYCSSPLKGDNFASGCVSSLDCFLQ